MGKINSKQKGNRGEREVASLLREFGFEARRGQQFSGSPESPDVVHNIPNFHIEVKRTETFSVYKALEQANSDKGSSEAALVFHRRSNQKWVVCLEAESFLQLLVDRHQKVSGLCPVVESQPDSKPSDRMVSQDNGTPIAPDTEYDGKGRS